MVQPRLDGAGDGHGPHAEQQGGGDKALGEAAAALPFDQLGAEQLPGALQAALNVDGAAEDAPDDHAHDDAQHVRRAGEVADAHPQHAQAQGMGEDAGEAFADEVFEQQACGAAGKHQNDVDDRGRHHKSPFAAK